MKTYYVYIMSSGRRTLYVGLTGDLQRRVHEHRDKLIDGFTKRYNVTHLVYFETMTDVHEAIAREKTIKKWSRAKKIALIKSTNPKWKDLSRSANIAAGEHPFFHK
ncbi:MAG TPA: GIY-YIG nuclease family protein [Gemmatimonadales bacterium]|nr:GIY-YIG nuclease family protein [Gemmatimonadales bacterium]